ncbi:toll/interleukin-1 receptor domain-containing protein [Parapedobacter indicus]|uniref:SEFIR domain-containing protein n=1 Tax=Parapedobacter indicus TaxID=1477437 RepID=A0A1I3VH71_9SPHI|nr:SEFIR domain-containing protein [Parapedobacter indicus]PPK98305.1 SEFIR domain-containing protein [Parapedobacter indicus]SFJ94532.1 SEFIR domain-containing protein [Parapedobacter indicus]
MSNHPKVFISYSWSNPDHENWVVNLAERLVADGVDVTIDKWDLKEGQDKYTFMESMVKSNDIQRVLIILDKKYADKAEQRAGGVGTETQIISPQIYENVSQEKFIPIVTEKDDKGDAHMPTYLKGRIYLDFSEQTDFENNYENLLRNIFKRPAYSKPKIGTPPPYLFEDTPHHQKTSSLVRSFDNLVNKNPNRLNPMIRDFLDEYYTSIDEFVITFTSRDTIDTGKTICDNIQSYTPLRDDFILFFDKVFKLGDQFDIDILIHFLERTPQLTYPRDERGQWYDGDYDNFRFFVHEIFLYLIALGLKNENYRVIDELLHSNYFFKSRYEDKVKPKQFTELYGHIASIKQYYNQTFSQNFFSPMADLIIKRIPKGMSKDQLIDADLICHYVAELSGSYWFPITYIYRSRRNLDLLGKLVSQRFFEKVKGIFNVANAEEFRNLLQSYKERNKNPERVSYSGSFDRVLPIYEIVEIDNVATIR